MLSRHTEIKTVGCLNDTWFYTGLYFLKSYGLVLKANNILKVVSVVAHSWFEWKNKVFPLFYFIFNFVCYFSNM